ncbi:transposase [Streptomyces sp. GC420]|uniref:IS701 family transposase n=1 Tax=Streptomyces sp. GC420 TaxID=2697568 RepID=UPI001414EA3D|nr:transposase [Streptomyces sp. GC420]NBM14269.1 transposase [Streptomyces sp. GC420]
MDTVQSDGSSSSRHATCADDPELALDLYSRTIFKSLRRTDQRKWAHAYLRGLLVTSGKKSVRRIATAISRDPSVVQSLRQFVSLSPWDFDEVMAELTHWVTQHRPAAVWSIGRAVLPKRGDRSVGVHRYFDLSSGRTLNCQLGLGAFLCVDGAQVPVDWCLHLPTTWTREPDRRAEARIPESEQYRPLWAQALRLVERLSARTGSSSSVVLVDMSDEPDVGYLLHGLTKRRRDFVVAVPPHLAVLPAGEKAPAPVSARTLVHARSQGTAVVSLPDGQQPSTPFQTSLVHLPGSSQGRSPGPLYRLFTEVGRNCPRPLWLTSLAHHAVAEVGSIAAFQSGTAAVIGSMEQDFGLLDFEGRSFPGWYHHMALVSAAYAFQRLHGLTSVASRSRHSQCHSLAARDFCPIGGPVPDARTTTGRATEEPKIASPDPSA